MKLRYTILKAHAKYKKTMNTIYANLLQNAVEATRKVTVHIPLLQGG